MADPKKRKTNLTNVWDEAKVLIRAHRGRLALGLVLMLISRVAGLIPPASSKYLIDYVIGRQRGDLLLPLALAVGAAALVDAVTSFALSQVLGVAAQRAIADMRASMQAHVTRLPIRYFDQTQTGILISRVMNDADGIRNLVGTGLVQLVGGLVTATIALGVLFYLNWRLTAISIVVLALFAVGLSTAFKRLRPLFRERGKITAEISGRLAESFGGIRIVKAYTAEEREDKVFALGVDRLFLNVKQTLTGISAVTAFGGLIIGTIGMIMILVGGRSILAGTMSLGDLFMYIFFVGLLAAPLIQMSSIGTQLSEAMAGLDRIREIKSMATEDDEDESREPLGVIQGDVIFEDVSFEYDAGVPVLKHVSFASPAGSTTALVGSSGSGKSTLISLVLAFGKPITGKVVVDGRDLAAVRLRDYRSQLGVVLQDNFMFDGTVAENIRFSRPAATMEQVKAVSVIAHCDEFIERFPNKYETIVGERGVKLSGGQRQRVAIARAILADPRILILDEATSSLDSESEALIQDGLRALRKGRTTFVIAHRLSTIRSADQILVLEAGEIVERGTHQQLLAANGRYRQLHDKQYKIEEDRFVNPGEDFTPDLPKAMPDAARAGRQSAL
ncbi:MAG TPA: ABC transporter ATP-binding protein [Vicinamibacterales bacterium]|nr:ABC transporter ATP-binding protein [Vicinamibacterales bacterium]